MRLHRRPCDSHQKRGFVDGGDWLAQIFRKNDQILRPEFPLLTLGLDADSTLEHVQAGTPRGRFGRERCATTQQHQCDPHAVSFGQRLGCPATRGVLELTS